MKIKHLLTKTLLAAALLCVGQNVWAYDITLTSSYAVENYSKAFYVNFQTKTIDDETDFATAFTYGGDFTQSADRGLQNTGSGDRSFTFTKSLTKGQLIIVQAGQTSSFGMKIQLGSTVVNPIKNDGYYAFYVTEDVTTSITITIGRLNYLLAMQVLTPSNNTYVVNAMTSDGKFLKQIATGTYESNATIYYPACVEKDGVIYKKNQNGSDPYWGFINIAAGLRSVVYTATDYVYYSEVEDMTFNKNGSSFASLRTDKATNPGRYSGGSARNFYQKQMVYTSALPLGVYSVTLYARNGGSGDRTGLSVKLRDSEGNYSDAVASLGTWTAAQCAEKTVTLLVPEDNNICIYEAASANSDIQIDYVYVRKLYDVTDPSMIVGAVDFSTGANGANSSDYIMKPGDTKVFTFQNHGQDFGKNWRIAVKEGETWKANVCADSYDYTVGAATKVSYQVSKDGGSSKVALDWTEFQADMADALVVATLAYGFDGTLAITTTSTGVANGYIYYVDQDVTGLTGDVTVNLSVNESWLEILSVEQTTVGAAIGSTGYTTFASSYPLNIDGMTASTGTVKAYYVTASDVKSSSVALTEVTGNVEAGTGLILEGTADATITIPVAASGIDYTAKNKLVGCTVNTDITASTPNYENFYVLIATEAAFKKIQNWVDVPNTLTIPAGKAYLDTTGTGVGAPSLTFDFNGEATGIADVRSKMEEVRGDIFDLQGRKVAQPQKGLYIQNGRKVILK